MVVGGKNSEQGKSVTNRSEFGKTQENFRGAHTINETNMQNYSQSSNAQGVHQYPIRYAAGMQSAVAMSQPQQIGMPQQLMMPQQYVMPQQFGIQPGLTFQGMTGTTMQPMGVTTMPGTSMPYASMPMMQSAMPSIQGMYSAPSNMPVQFMPTVNEQNSQQLHTMGPTLSNRCGVNEDEPTIDSWSLQNYYSGRSCPSCSRGAPSGSDVPSTMHCTSMGTCNVHRRNRDQD